MTSSAKKLRKTVLEMAYYGQDANLQSIFSSIDIIDVLYQKVLKISPDAVDNPDRDYFVLSKGQATMGLLSELAVLGFLPLDEIKTACRIDSRISMQADRTKLPGVEISAGSLGHGFPIAVGIAWGNKLSGRRNNVYVLAGDGEMNEGTMWEAALFAASEKLSNLTLIVDDNSSLQTMLDVGDIGEKLKAFGFDVRYADGHSEEDLFQNLVDLKGEKPHAIIANTIRGYGAKTLMTDNTWFHRAPTKEELYFLQGEVDQFDKEKLSI